MSTNQNKHPYLKGIAAIRLKNELKMVKKHMGDKIRVEMVTTEDGFEDISRWRLFIEGTENTIFKDYILEAKVNFPSEYPKDPFVFTFVTKMWHPNIYPDGRVCISILHPPSDARYDPGLESCCWSPAQNVMSVTISILSMLDEPNINSIAHIEAASQYRKDKSAYDETVKETLNKHAVLKGDKNLNNK